MKVVCGKRKRSDLTLDSCKPYAAEIAYELEIGKTYTVYGQYLARGCLFYLIAAVDREGLSHPTWYPAAFFDITDGAVPPSWLYIYNPEHEAKGVTAIWGYPELLRDDHFAGLQEREEDHMMTWLRRKAQIDESNASGHRSASFEE